MTTTTKFVIMNEVEIKANDDGSVAECHVAIALRDEDGVPKGDVPLGHVLYALLDVVASIWKRTDKRVPKDEFIFDVELILRESIEAIKVSEVGETTFHE